MLFLFHMDFSGAKYIHKMMESLLDESNNKINVTEANINVETEDIIF